MKTLKSYSDIQKISDNIKLIRGEIKKLQNKLKVLQTIYEPGTTNILNVQSEIRLLKKIIQIRQGKIPIEKDQWIKKIINIRQKNKQAESKGDKEVNTEKEKKKKQQD